jgi:hypothetical protein
VNKKSREQFQLSSYKRLLDIYSSSSKTIDALMKLELPSGVEVEIKCNEYLSQDNCSTTCPELRAKEKRLKIQFKAETYFSALMF